MLTAAFALQVSSPLQPPAQGSGSFSPARVRQSPVKFRQPPALPGDGAAAAGSAALPMDPMPVPTRAKRTQNRHAGGLRLLCHGFGPPDIMCRSTPLRAGPRQTCCSSLRACSKGYERLLKSCLGVQGAEGPRRIGS